MPRVQLGLCFVMATFERNSAVLFNEASKKFLSYFQHQETAVFFFSLVSVSKRKQPLHFLNEYLGTFRARALGGYYSVICPPL